MTVIMPSEDSISDDNAFAGDHLLNGYGEMTGLIWIEQSGRLSSDIGITNTHQVRIVRDTFVKCSLE